MSETVDAIMDAAERRIRDAGYDGFSFRDIAADVGIKSASIYYHFPTKEGLGAAVARRYRERFLSAIDHVMAEGRPPIAVWTKAFRDALHSDGRMCLCGVLGAATGNIPDEVQIEARRFFEFCLEKLVENGLSRPKASQVMATLEGAMLLAHVLGKHAAFDDATAALD